MRLTFDVVHYLYKTLTSLFLLFYFKLSYFFILIFLYSWRWQSNIETSCYSHCIV